MQIINKKHKILFMSYIINLKEIQKMQEKASPNSKIPNDPNIPNDSNIEKYRPTLNNFNNGWTGNSEIAKKLKSDIFTRSKKVGKGYTFLYDSISKNINISQEARLIFTVISRYAYKCDTTNITQDQIGNKIGMSKPTVSKYVKELETERIIQVKNKMNAGKRRKEYVIIVDREKMEKHYEFVTDVFLETKDITCCQKAFICCILPHVLGNNLCSYTIKEMEVKTGMSERTIKRRIKELKSKTLMDKVSDGYKVNIEKIMSIGLDELEEAAKFTINEAGNNLTGENNQILKEVDFNEEKNPLKNNLVFELLGEGENREEKESLESNIRAVEEEIEEPYPYKNI